MIKIDELCHDVISRSFSVTGVMRERHHHTVHAFTAIFARSSLHLVQQFSILGIPTTLFSHGLVVSFITIRPCETDSDSDISLQGSFDFVNTFTDCL
jgi:hypothetical protein